MDKVLVKLYVPVLEEVYDIWIPTRKKIYNVVKLILRIIDELNEYGYNSKEFPNLYDKATAEKYDMNLTIKESSIRNGSELILI